MLMLLNMLRVKGQLVTCIISECIYLEMITSSLKGRGANRKFPDQIKLLIILHYRCYVATIIISVLKTIFAQGMLFMNLNTYLHIFQFQIEIDFKVHTFLRELVEHLNRTLIK